MSAHAAHAGAAAAPVITGAATLTAAELDDPAAAELLRGERLRSVSLEARLLLATARLALRDAGRCSGDDASFDPGELGIVVATRHSGLQEYVDLYRAGTEGERPRVNPARGPQTGLNAPAAELSIRLPAAGPNATLCADDDVALQYARDQLAAGRAAAMLVCALELAPPILHAQAPHEDRATVVVLEAHPADVHDQAGAPPR